MSPNVSPLIREVAHRSCVRQAVTLAKKNIDFIKGRVLLQTLPSKAYDEQATLDHARLYDQEFRRVGISRKRYCVKIPATGPALNAAKTLEQEKDADGLGIPTLGTAIFGLSQAIACSQAGMLYISPYFNGEFGLIGTHHLLALHFSRCQSPLTNENRNPRTQRC